MAHVKVPSEASYTRSASATGTGPYAFTFTVFEKDDVEVRLDGAALATSAWSVTWDTSDTGGYTGGSITLNSAPTATATLDIVSVIQSVRGTDFGAGPLSVSSLNTEFDKVFAMLRDVQRDIARAPLLDLADTPGGDLPLLSGNASKVLAVNSSGTALEWATNAGGGGGSGSGNVSNTGTPANNQLAVWTNSTTIEGDSSLTWNGSVLGITGSITVGGVAVPTISSASTLTNKTIALGSNTVSGTKAQFNTACTDGTFAFSGGAFHDGFSDFVSDEHVAHSGVTLTAGAGLTGGGTIAASRSFAVGAGTGITVNADDVQINLGANLTWTGAHNFTGGSIKVPAGATPTIAAQGDFALDTSVTNYAPGALRYHDGTNDMHVVAVAASVMSATPTNGHVLTYDATNDIFYLAAAPGAGGGISGTGSNDQIAVFSGTGSVDSSTALTFNGTTLGLGATLTINSGTGSDAVYAEDGISFSSTAAETFNIQNSGTGSVTLQVDGSAVMSAASTATLTNKTFDLGGTGNTLTGSKAEFNTALQSDTFVMNSDLGANVATFLGTPSSTNLAAAVTGETGSGALVFGTSPSITTPTLVLQDANGAAPTTDGQIKFDRTGENLEVGNGTGTISFSNDTTNASTYAPIAGGTAIVTVGALDAGSITSNFGTINIGTSAFTGGSVFLNEKAAADADVAGDGQLWVVNSTPNVLKFTDDAGTDWTPSMAEDLASTSNGLGASLIGIEDSGALITATTVEGALAELAAAAGISASGTPANDQVAVWTGSATAEGSAGLTYSATTGLYSQVSDAATNTVVYPVTVSHVTSGTSTAGFGAGIKATADNATGTDHEIGTLEFVYVGSTAGFEDSNVNLYAYKSGSKQLVVQWKGADPSMHTPGTIFMTERASAVSDTAGEGQLWVKTATPNELWFTNDAGNDIQLTSGTAIVGGGGGISGTGANNRVVVWSGTATADSTAGFEFDGTNLSIPNSLYVTEQAAADADTAGDGQLWVRNDVPNTLMFTDDAGNDAVVRKSGVETIWIPATAMITRTTGGAAAGTAETTTNKVMLQTYDFDAATDEFTQFEVTFPKSWNAGTVTAQFYWSNASGTGNVIWGLQGLALADSDVLDTAFGTAQTVTDGVTTAGDLMVTTTTSAITIAGSPGADEKVTFQAYRDANATGDTLAGDARLHGIKLFYTTNAANDD